MDFILDKADYHIHTYFSDGTLSPSEVVDRFHEEGYEIIAITDHDGTAGIPEAAERASLYGMTLIPGIEFSTRNGEGIGLHILGYGMDIRDRKLQSAVERIRAWRRERNDRLIRELGLMGYPLSEEDLTLREGQDFIGKPVLARAMVRKGYISDVREAFGEGILGSPRVRAIKKRSITPLEAVRIIRDAGGVAVLAHPGKIKDIGDREEDIFYENVERILEPLVAAGLGGLECCYPEHTAKDTQTFLGMAEKHGLKVTKGSDFHAPGEKR